MSEPGKSENANRDQASYWNSATGEKWTLFQHGIDTVFQSVNDRLLERAGPRPGESILDIGCGTGATSMDFASKVGADGRVLGVDISRPLLQKAGERRSEAGIDHIEYLLADAQTYEFAANHFDLIASRFGVMFFSDPIAAFANMAKALRPGGRLSVVAWAGMAENPWFEAPRNAAVNELGEPSPASPTAPGPLAFADRDYVLEILRKAGYADCRAEAEEVFFQCPGSLDDTAFLASNIGPSARIVKEFNGSREDIAAIARRVGEDFARYAVDDGLNIPAKLNFFDAVRPSSTPYTKGH